MNNTQSGNVLFYILIAVALLASLMFAVSQSGRGSAKQISEERAKLIAAEILEYSHIVSNAVSQLRLRGCQDIELNFDNNIVAGYTNTAAPTDGSCDIFSVNGGGVQWRNPEEEWIDNSHSAEDDYGEMHLTGKACIDEIGNGTTDCQADGASSSEIILVMPFLREEVCIQLNNKLEVGVKDAAPPQDVGPSWTSGGRKFTGDTTYAGGTRIQDTGLILNGQAAACFEGDTYPTAGYHFYKVVNVR
jgi:hypothetical protein